MNKLIAILLFVSQFAFGLNFSGVQSIEGLHPVNVFTAPAQGYYFVNGQLTFQMAGQVGLGGATAVSTNGVYAVVSKNTLTATPVQLYLGVPGATGFQLNNISLTTGDAIRVALYSSISGSGIQGGGDATLNSTRGQIYFGNSF